MEQLIAFRNGIHSFLANACDNGSVLPLLALEFAVLAASVIALRTYLSQKKAVLGIVIAVLFIVQLRQLIISVPRHGFYKRHAVMAMSDLVITEGVWPGLAFEKRNSIALFFADYLQDAAIHAPSKDLLPAAVMRLAGRTLERGVCIDSSLDGIDGASMEKLSSIPHIQNDGYWYRDPLSGYGNEKKVYCLRSDDTTVYVIGHSVYQKRGKTRK